MLESDWRSTLDWVATKSLSEEMTSKLTLESQERTI